MRPTDLAKPSAFVQHIIKQWIGVKHIYHPRMRPQTLLQIRHHPSQSRLRKRIKEIEHDRLRGKKELRCIRANRLQRKALLRFASVFAEVLLSGRMQSRQKFHTHDLAKGIIRSHEQRTSFARPEIDKDKVVEIRMTLLAQSLQHFAEQFGLGGLIRRVEDSEQAIAPTYRGAGRVDAVFPIIFDIAVTLATALRSRLANELPQRRQQSAACRDPAFARGNVTPPLPRRARQAYSGWHAGIAAAHSSSS